MSSKQIICSQRSYLSGHQPNPIRLNDSMTHMIIFEQAIPHRSRNESRIEQQLKLSILCKRPLWIRCLFRTCHRRINHYCRTTLASLRNIVMTCCRLNRRCWKSRRIGIDDLYPGTR
jgi:hypothetical protein